MCAILIINANRYLAVGVHMSGGLIHWILRLPPEEVCLHRGAGLGQNRYWPRRSSSKKNQPPNAEMHTKGHSGRPVPRAGGRSASAV